MLFNTILFATDFSDVSSSALGYVLRLREAGCEKVVLVHVIDEGEINIVLSQPSGFVEPSGEYETEIVRRMSREVEQKLDVIRITLEEAGFRVSPHLIKGVPYLEIIRIADAEGASLIIVGSHGRSDIGQMLLGSVSENVIRHARQPVLVVRRGYVPGENE